MPKPVVEKTEQELQDERLLSVLLELGGKRVSDEDLIRQGDQLILPERWDTDEAISFLEKHKKQMEEETNFSKTYKFRPHDGALALQNALKRVFGTAGLAKATWTFFGKQPPELVTVPTGVDTSVQVPWGAMEVPLFGGTLYTHSDNDRELGPLFMITITTQRRFKSHVEGLFRIVEEELRKSSIYRGKAINGAVNPEFIDLRGVDPAQVIYSEATTMQLEANIWALLRWTDQMVRLGIPLKRANLLEGPYGCGKTLAAFLTAQIAIENGWTFVYCRPGRDNLFLVMQTARLYQPSVVFYEDVDTIASGGDADDISRLLDLFDGITAKGTKLMLILTTNHKEDIVKGMLRPGRLDSLIHIGALDVKGIERMIKSKIDEEMRDLLDYDAIAESMEIGTPNAFTPAFVGEAIDKTVRYSLARNEGKPTVLVTADFIYAAEGLKPQLALMNDASEGERENRLGVILKELVEDAIDGVQVTRQGNYFGELEAPDPDEIEA